MVFAAVLWVTEGLALPVATPPNAIAFGTGSIDRGHMLRAGLRLDVAMILLSSGFLLAVFLLR